jgi:DNA-binding Lrp family transcriptional regulator
MLAAMRLSDFDRTIFANNAGSGILVHKSCTNKRFTHDMSMDHFDVKILASLQADGRLTNHELADKVGLSASQCSRRRSALEDAGAIASYHAHLDASAMGLGVTALVQVTLATHSPDNSKRFQKLIDGLAAVQEAYSLTGEADYVIKLIVPDLAALARILNDVFLPHESVAHVRSSIVLERLKQTPVLPLDHLLPQRPLKSSAARPRARVRGGRA